MSDLVKKLRSRVDGVVFPDELASEAADRIEELQNALADIVIGFDDNKYFAKLVFEIRKVLDK